MNDEEIEELEDEDVELEEYTSFNLYWTCKECKEENIEYDVTTDGIVECQCSACGKKYTYYNCIY